MIAAWMLAAAVLAPLPAFGTAVTFDTDIGSANDGLIADVQAWVDDPAVNFGWEYRISEEDELDNARLLSPGSITVHWVAQLEFEDGFESP